MSSTIAFPTEFLSTIANIMPKTLAMDDFIQACQRPLRRSIRINTLKISVDDFMHLMQPQGWFFDPIPWCAEGFWITLPCDEMALGNLVEHLAGLFYIQESSSMMPPSALFAGDHFERVLDLAAAPGSKTTQIGAYQQHRGLIVANEYSASRVKVLHANCKRMGLHNVAITHFDGRVHGDYLAQSFDAVLIDAPCSGEGTIRKDPGAFKNWSQRAIDEIAQTQRELLRSAFLALKPGGQLVYSTCALNGHENQQVCAALLSDFPGQVDVSDLSELFDGADRCATPEGYLHVWPQIYDSEGFFVAKFRKLQGTGHSTAVRTPHKFPFQPLEGQRDKLVKHTFWSDFEVDLERHGKLYRRDKEIWLFPAGIDPLLTKMRFQRIGIKIGELFNKGFNLLHEAAITLATNGLELSREQACLFYKGQDIPFENNTGNKGQVIVCYQQVPIGFCKWVGHKLKNKLPRELVNDNPQ